MHCLERDDFCYSHRSNLLQKILADRVHRSNSNAPGFDAPETERQKTNGSPCIPVEDDSLTSYSLNIPFHSHNEQTTGRCFISFLQPRSGMIFKNKGNYFSSPNNMTNLNNFTSCFGTAVPHSEHSIISLMEKRKELLLVTNISLFQRTVEQHQYRFYIVDDCMVIDKVLVRLENMLDKRTFLRMFRYS